MVFEYELVGSGKKREGNGSVSGEFGNCQYVLVVSGRILDFGSLRENYGSGEGRGSEVRLQCQGVEYRVLGRCYCGSPVIDSVRYLSISVCVGSGVCGVVPRVRSSRSTASSCEIRIRTSRIELGNRTAYRIGTEGDCLIRERVRR